MVRQPLLIAAIAMAALAGCATTTPQTQSSASSTLPASPSAKPSPTTRPSTEFANSTFDVAAFPPPWDLACPAGTRRFVDGYALIEERPAGEEYASATGLSINARIPAVVADLDGQPGNEAIIMMQCATEGASLFTPAALKLDATGKVVGFLGFVVYEPGKPLPPASEDKAVSVADGVVVVEIFDGIQRQTRGYRYQGATFVQVSGPKE